MSELCLYICDTKRQSYGKNLDCTNALILHTFISTTTKLEVFPLINDQYFIPHYPSHPAVAS